MKELKRAIHRMLNRFGFDMYRLPRYVDGSGNPAASLRIPDSEYYRPLFSPWLGYGKFSGYHSRARNTTLVSPDRCWILFCLCQQSLSVVGDIWECGVYKGGTAAMLAQVIGDGSTNKQLHLFDTFRGMPETDTAIDIHKTGHFGDTTLAEVRDHVKHDAFTVYHQGLIPETFRNMEDSAIALAHIDVDIRQSVMDCCQFIYPRLSVGGFMVFDDYGFPACPGARKAVDEYFTGGNVVPLVLPTGQAVIFKSRCT